MLKSSHAEVTDAHFAFNLNPGRCATARAQLPVRWIDASKSDKRGTAKKRKALGGRASAGAKAHWLHIEVLIKRGQFHLRFCKPRRECLHGILLTVGQERAAPELRSPPPTTA
jgi:hypothetical protein